MEIFQDILLSFSKKNDTKNRKGINAINPMIHFTIKSATASDTHNGESEPMVKNGTISHAQEISPFAASENSGIWEENAIVKKIVVSIKKREATRPEEPSTMQLSVIYWKQLYQKIEL